MGAPWEALYRSGAPYHGPAPPPFFAPFLPDGALVLDLGCGAGKSLAALRAAGPRWTLVGLDAAAGAVRLAAPRAPCVRGDASALPLRDASVDAVRIHHLLGHLEPAQAAACAQEVERVLRPQGWLEVREAAAGDVRDGTGTPAGPGAWSRGGIVTRYLEQGTLTALFPRCRGHETVASRAVRFSARPRRALVLRARRA